VVPPRFKVRNTKYEVLGTCISYRHAAASPAAVSARARQAATSAAVDEPAAAQAPACALDVEVGVGVVAGGGGASSPSARARLFARAALRLRCLRSRFASVRAAWESCAGRGPTRRRRRHLPSHGQPRPAGTCGRTDGEREKREGERESALRPGDHRTPSVGGSAAVADGSGRRREMYVGELCGHGLGCHPTQRTRVRPGIEP